MRASKAIAIVRVMQEDRGLLSDRLAGEESEALSVVLELAEGAEGRLPRLLAPGEEIPPGCTASLRAAIVAGPGGTMPVVDEARGRIYYLPAAPSRSFLPQGCSTKEIEAAAGVAARELVAEHGAPAGTLVEVRLVRRGEQAPERQDVVANVRKARAVAEAADIREAQERVDALRAGVASYAGGDRAPSPPVRLLRELREA